MWKKSIFGYCFELEFQSLCCAFKTSIFVFQYFIIAVYVFMVISVVVNVIQMLK